MAVVALKPKRGYSFTDHATVNPSTPPPGDKLDGEVDRLIRSIGEIIDWVSVSIQADGHLRPPPRPTQAKPRVSAASASAPTVLGPGSGTHIIAGADPTATAQDWAEVSAEWAEHMPDIIPPNILTVMGITGDHWSARWWANRALEIVESLAGGPGGPARAILSSTAPIPASPGDLWWDTVSGQLFVFYMDLSSNQWVPATNQPAPAAVATPAPPLPANILAPASGETVVLPDTRPVYINNPGPYASLAIRMPAAALGQMVEISFANPVSILAMQTSAGVAIPNSPTSAYGPGAALQFRFEAPGWIYWK
jgi:hypothetical protein